jgi:hypothetical protein
MGERIRIVNPDPDPGSAKIVSQKEEKRNFMLEEFSIGLEAYPRVCLQVFVGV